MTRVLIVEDDESMATALKDGFEYEGHTVSLVRDGAAGLRAALDNPPDLMILDVMLPKMSGFDVLRDIRGKGSNIPIIMLTARGQEIDKVLGLKLGADDYLTKPFGFLELIARVEALLRRAHGRERLGEIYQFSDITVNFRENVVRKKGKEVDMSPREMRLLRFFIEHRAEVVSREAILDAVWDYDSAPLTRTVDMHVAKLRGKLEDDMTDPRHIITVHRVGYKFTG